MERKRAPPPSSSSSSSFSSFCCQRISFDVTVERSKEAKKEDNESTFSPSIPPLVIWQRQKEGGGSFWVGGDLPLLLVFLCCFLVCGHGHTSVFVFLKGGKLYYSGQDRKKTPRVRFCLKALNQKQKGNSKSRLFFAAANECLGKRNMTHTSSPFCIPTV